MITWAADDVWTQLRPRLTPPGRKFAAIAFVSKAAPKLLHLRSGDTILICADHESLASGSTDPSAVASWLRDGVEVWSVPSLHAKFVVFASKHGAPNSLFIGSANASARASNERELARSLEAGVLIDDAEVAEEARVKIEVWKARADPARPLDAEWVRHARRVYRAPRRNAASPDRAGARPVDGGRTWLGMSFPDSRALTSEATRALYSALDSSGLKDIVVTWTLNEGDEHVVKPGDAVSLVPMPIHAQSPDGRYSVLPPAHVAYIATFLNGPPVAILVYDGSIRPRRTWARVRQAIEKSGGIVQFDKPLDSRAQATLHTEFFGA